MGSMRESLETSIAAAIELEVLDPDEHAAVIEGARAAADALDADNATASMLGTYLNYCKALGIAPTEREQPQVIGSGRIASLRASSRARKEAS